jgi:hypothetical protein
MIKSEDGLPLVQQLVMHRQIIRTSSSTIPAPKRRPTTNTGKDCQGSPGWCVNGGEMVMDETGFAFWLTLTGTLCWVVCFWWMHRISTKQNALLDQLHAQGKRIEKLSKIEHDLIKEVHPRVSEIKEGMDTMVAAVKETNENNPSVSK